MFLQGGVCQLFSKGTLTCRWFPTAYNQHDHSQLIDVPHVTNLTFVVYMIGSLLPTQPARIKFSLPPV